MLHHIVHISLQRVPPPDSLQWHTISFKAEIADFDPQMKRRVNLAEEQIIVA